MPREPGNDIQLGEILGHGGQLTLRRDQHGRHQRGRHVFVCGSSGVGKSKLLESMIRQDISRWHDSHCGLMLLDPHGAVYNGLMEWLAEYEETKLPIIPIDLTRDDYVASYNVLRRRKEMEKSVVVAGFIEAISHAWGEINADSTPRFSNLGSMVLDTLYHFDFTLAEASTLLTRVDLQRTLAARLPKGRVRDAWHRAILQPKEFGVKIESTENRFARFEENPLLRAMLGQTEDSLDLARALEEGHIILVNLSTERGKVSRQDADTFGTLLMSDLWAAAGERGKKQDVKPFYLYVDEFQTMTTPTIARGLDQARGHGLHLTLACQYPNQLLNDGGKGGKALYDSVLANAQNKVVFRSEHPDNLDTLARQLFMGTFNPNMVKDEIHSTKVIQYQEVIREDETEGSAEITGGSQSTSSTSGSNIGHGEGESYLSSDSGEQELSAWNLMISDTHGESESWGESTSESWAKAKSQSKTRRHVLIPILGKELTSRQFRGLDEQLFIASQQLFLQEDRHCAVKVSGSRAPVFIRTKNLARGRAMPVRVERFLNKQRAKWEFIIPMQEATIRLSVREQKLLDYIHEPQNEPKTAKRRVKL